MGVVKVRAMGLDFRRAVALVLLTSLATGCGKIKDNSAFEGLACGASDQYRTYMNPMDSNVLQTVSIDSSFSTAEIHQIESAIATWNAEGRRAVGRDLFRTQVLAVSANAIPTASQDCGFPGVSGAFSIVKVTDPQTWSNLGFSANNPGVTIRCSQGRGYASKQIVLLNTANMSTFVQIFESVVLHELGHAIGLDHSCDAANAGVSGFAGCGMAGTDPSYKEAVMYPYVNPSELREDLRRNDEERAICSLNYRP